MEGIQNNNQQSGNKLTPQQQYMMAQKQAYMQRMRQQYLYQQRMMQQRMAQQNQQGFVKQTMQSPQQVANQMNKQNINPMQNANVGFVNQPINNSPEYNFYKFNQQPVNQNDFANKSQVKIQWKFDEGAKQNIPEQQVQPNVQPVQEPQQEQVQNIQTIQQPQVEVQEKQMPQAEKNIELQDQVQEEIENEEDQLKGLKVEFEGQTYDLEHMSIEEIEDFKEYLVKRRGEIIAKINMMLTRDPNLNPVRLEDFPYYDALKNLQKGV